MKYAALAPSVVALALSLLAFACSSKNGGGPPGEADASVEAGMVPSFDAGTVSDAASASDAGDAGDAGDATAPPEMPQAFFRLAALVDDAPPMDVCVAPHGTTAFTGPLLAAISNAADAGRAGVSFTEVSAYLGVAPGDYDLRFVRGDATTCAPSRDDAGVPGVNIVDAPGLLNIGVNTFATVFVSGDSHEGVGLTRLTDDTVLLGGGASLRAFNAVAMAPAVDIGLGAFDAGFQPLFAAAPFGLPADHAGTGEGTPDSNGYLTIAPLSSATLSAHLSTGAMGDLAVAKNVTIDLGTIATVIVVGAKAGDPMGRPALVLCVDNQRSGGTLATCSVLP